MSANIPILRSGSCGNCKFFPAHSVNGKCGNEASECFGQDKTSNDSCKHFIEREKEAENFTSTVSNIWG